MTITELKKSLKEGAKIYFNRREVVLLPDTYFVKYFSPEYARIEKRNSAPIVEGYFIDDTLRMCRFDLEKHEFTIEK